MTTIMKKYEQQLNTQKKAAKKALTAVEVEIMYLSLYTARRARRAKRKLRRRRESEKTV